MTDPQTYAAILGFVAFSVPIVGALWKIFNIRAALQLEILENRNRLILLEQHVGHLVDAQQHFLNGITERLQHVRDRSKHAEDGLDLRLSDLEGYIEKTTAFTRRKRGE